MNRLFSLLADWRQRRVALPLAFLLGAAMPLALAPLTWWPVALLALGVFSELLREQTPRRAALLSYLFGVGLWLHGASWLVVSMHDYGGTSWPLSLLLLAFVAAVMALLYWPLGWLAGVLRSPRRLWLILPALWVAGEWLRSWVFTGFPWLMTGYGFIDTPLAGWAPLLGIYGVSFAAGVTAVALMAIWREGKQAPAAILMLGLLWIGGGLLKPVAWTQIDRTKPVSVSLVQGNIPQESKWALEWRDKTVKIFRDMTASEWGRDVVVWPEAAIPMFAHEAQLELMELESEALKHQTAFVTGVPYATWNPSRTGVLFYNSIVALGDGFGIYHKQQLVPMGEYVPFEHLLRGLIPFFNLPMSSFSWGPAEQPPLGVKQYRMAPFICYEIAYPSLVQRLSQDTAFLATISNDGWFGRSIGPAQHLQMVRMRALETGRYILRGTNNGATAIIDEQGRITAAIPSFERRVLRGEVYPASGLTPWQRLGVLPVLLLCGLVLVTAGALRWRQQRQQ